MTENAAKTRPMPKARISYMPNFSGNGFGYGGAAVVSFDGAAINFGEGGMADQLARQVASAVNLHDKMRATLEWLDRKGGLGMDVHERIRDALSIG